MKERVFTLAVIMMLSFFGLNGQTIRYVKEGGTGDGSSWDNASGDIKAMIAASAANDQIWVAKGTYQPPVKDAFIMKEGVSMYGHFAGTETSLSQRNLATTDTTVLKGNGLNVIYNEGNGLTRATVLDGFTITGGYGYSGGGIHNNGSSPTISNCIFSKNLAFIARGGGGMGGGISNVNCSPLFINVVIMDNTAESYGGGIYDYNASPTFVNCIIKKNIAQGRGSGVDQENGGKATFVNCIFTDNHSKSSINITSSALNLYNSIVVGNNSGINYLPTATIQSSLIQGLGADAQLNNLDGTTITADQVFTNPSAGDYSLKAGSPCINAGNNDLYRPIIPLDLAGNRRLLDTSIDMGAYEYQSGSPFMIWEPDVNGILYVKKNNGGSGASWTDAMSEVSDALAAARSNPAVKQIWVAGGTYQPPVNDAFIMKEGVSMYGHFAGTETSLSQRNLATTDTTVLKGNGLNVIYNDGNGLTRATVLDGFSITGGRAASGGGIHNVGSSPTISNCIISKNTAVLVYGLGRGGGISNGNCSPLFINVVISDNTAETYGGGIHNNNASPTFLNCIIRNNFAPEWGIGVYQAEAGGKATFINCTFTENKNGYAVYVYNSSISLYNTILIGNNSTGIYNHLSNVIIQSSLIQGYPADALNNNLDGTILTADQVFTNPSAGDYSLKAGSPCINAGNNTLYTNAGGDLAKDFDLAGNPRLFGGTIDMGAYERKYIPVIVPSTAGIVFVKKGGKGLADGSSWENACAEAAYALAGAKSNPSIKQIWVAGGTYNPMFSPIDIDSLQESGRDNSFLLVKDVKLFGGFAGTEKDLAQRDLNFTANASILSGDIGTPGTASDNAYQVVVSAGDAGTASLDGFTIRDGFADNSKIVKINQVDLARSNGGGLCLNASSPAVANCIIEQNFAKDLGGGIAADSIASLNILNTVVRNNKARIGGGISCENSALSLTDVTIQGNSASETIGSGGGVNMKNGKLELNNCNILSNIAFRGGGVESSRTSTKITHSKFIQNTSHYAGGGYLGINDTLDLKYSVFSKNVCSGGSLGSGGAIQLERESNGNIFNSVISENEAVGIQDDGGGGIMLYQNAVCNVVNSTFYNNKTSSTLKPDGNTISTVAGTKLTLINDIIYGDAMENLQVLGEMTAYSSSIKQTVLPDGFGIMNLNPMFVDEYNPAGVDGEFGTTDDGLALSPSSPCINSGINLYYITGGGNIFADTDFIGNPRLGTAGYIIDLGAYEASRVATGLNENYSSEDLEFYPNPVVSTISLKGLEGMFRMIILDITGKVIINTESCTSQINVSDLKSGVYVIKVSDSHGMKTGKFTKL